MDGPFDMQGMRLSTDAAGAQTGRSLGHHLLHPQILRILVLLKSVDFEAQSSLLQNRLYPQIQILNAYPDIYSIFILMFAISFFISMSYVLRLSGDQ